jgi:phosphate starvation-inducible protein PhoH and related proteins
MSPPVTTRGRAASAPVVVEFDDNRLLAPLVGEFDQHLARIEQALDVHLHPRGNQISISGPPDAVAVARAVLGALYGRLARDLPVDLAEVDAAVRIAAGSPAADTGAGSGDDMVIRLPRRHISARSAGQLAYIRALRDSDLVFGLGPAGTGKTYLAVATAVSELLSGEVDRIILSRPAVEAGERLGFLPGDMRDKIDPYLRPLFDSLHDMLPADQVTRRLATGEIEVAPLAFMRGRTLANAFVILDEAQNTTRVQMKMILTRLGENSRMVVTGDLSQIDLPSGAASGLRHAVSTVQGIAGVRVINFGAADVVRHDLVTRIVAAYDETERRQRDGDGGEKSR